MSCSYYEFRQGSYFCNRKSDYVNSDVYYRYCRSYNYSECPIYKNHERFDSSCYLSTACIISKGLSDDCTELKVLRNYRDNWLKLQPKGEEAIRHYYQIAPKIVSAINEKKDSDEIYNMIYEKIIVPCIALINKEQMSKAFEVYSNATNRLAKEYL